MNECIECVERERLTLAESLRDDWFRYPRSIEVGWDGWIDGALSWLEGELSTFSITQLRALREALKKGQETADAKWREEDKRRQEIEERNRKVVDGFPCPTCGEGPGDWCVSAFGEYQGKRRSSKPHLARRELAQGKGR